MALFYINWFGQWSYLVVFVPYFGLLLWLIMKYWVIWELWNFRFFLKASVLAMLVLGFGFEWIAQLLQAWTFPDGRYLFPIRIPIFGWLTGHPIPFEEALWIIAVVPLFYYLYFWATLVFHDIIYVIDKDTGKFYKREERWVGFHEPTRIRKRFKNERGQEHEVTL